MLKRIIFFLALVVLIFFGYRLINQEWADTLLTDIKWRIMPREKTNTKKEIVNLDEEEWETKSEEKNTKIVDNTEWENVADLEKEDEEENVWTNVVITNLDDSKGINSEEDTESDTNTADKDADNSSEWNSDKQVIEKQIVIVDYHDEEILDRFTNNVR